MKTTKLFFMAALALMTAACSNDDNDLTTQQPQKAEGITITAQLAPKTGGADTRAVSEDAVNNKIVSEWTVDEHIAVLYTKDATPYAADATITAVDGSGAATIEFTVEAGTPDNTACTLVYPLSAAKDDHTGVKDAATLLAAQDGTLNANLDVRVGAGTIQTSTPGLTVTTQPAAQFAIFKFTTKNAAGSATIDVQPLTITIGAQDYVITPASATSELFVALPAISSQEVSFCATGSDSETYTCSKAVTFAAGNYYQSTLKMATLREASSYTGDFDDAGIWDLDNGVLNGKTLTVAHATALAKYQKQQTGNTTAIMYDGKTNKLYYVTDEGVTGTVGWGYDIPDSAIKDCKIYAVNK
jgi:hypothetical protein